MTNLFIRADGGTRVGLGHLLRSHALSQAARRRGLAVRFLTRPEDGTGVRKLENLGEAVEVLRVPEEGAADLDATLAAMRRATGGKELGGTILVTDHNGLDADWIRGARTAGALVVSVNDLPKIHYDSRIVVNGNLGAERFAYDTAPDTRLLLGPSYCFFRDEFLDAGLPRAAHPDVARRILISLGGGDPRNVTQSILEKLDAVDASLDVTVLLGAAYVHRPSLEEAVRRCRHEVRIEADAPRTARLFARAETAVCAGGSTAYELALLGVPAVVLVLSDTQKDAAAALEASGAALCAGEPGEARLPSVITALLEDRPRREAMGKRGRALFDGLGRERVLDEVLALVGAPERKQDDG